MTQTDMPAYSWQEILPWMDAIRKQATDQFIAAWRTSQTNKAKDFVWHETMGYVVVKRDDAAKRAVLSPRAPSILADLGCEADPSLRTLHPYAQNKDHTGPSQDFFRTCWRPAHAKFAMRCSPYYFRNFSLNQLVYELPESLRSRRNEIKSHLAPDEMLLSISQFPLLGAGEYIDGQGPLNGPLLHSKLLSDDTLNAVPPFNLEINGISDRRGEVPLTGVPVFHDTNTPWPYIDPLLSANTSIPERLNGRDSACMIPEAKPQKELPGEPNAEGGASENFGSSAGCHEGEAADNCLYLDSPLFGIGSGGVLRVTLCAADLEEARILYDHLASMSAIMMALTAATPIVRGHLTDRDCYWNTQCSAVDDRSAQERGIVPITTAKGMLHKSRYGTVDVLLSPGPRSNDLSFRPQFNDGQYMYDDASYWKMREGGVDDLLAKHVSRLFIRDLHYASSYLLQETKKGSDSKTESNGQEHFKRFLGCNRQNICLYPPNIQTGSGWEVEFMSLEVQLTDEENAAFITFMVLLSRTILSFRLNLYLPVSLMDENTDRAQKANAARDQVFLFRRDMYAGRDGKSGGSGRIWRRPSPAAEAQKGSGSPSADGQRENGSKYKEYRKSSSSAFVDGQPYTAEYIELTLDEIMNGAPEFRVVGLLNAVRSYLSSLQLELDVEIRLRQQLKLIENRAKGQTSTLAAYMRGFVQKHPDYRQDSIVPPSTNYDLMRTLHDIEEGKVKAPELLG